MRFSCFVLTAIVAASSASVWAAARKGHTVGLGAVRRVPFVAAEAKEDETGTLRIRPLVVDDKIREWVIGDTHEITERSFVARRVMHINDALPGEKTGRWVWQPASWILVDRTSGRVTALHLPDFDASVSEVVWYRDYAAYCGIHTTAKTSNLTAEVWQIAGRRAALSKALSPWPQPERVRPVCLPAIWQREPMRVTVRPNGGDSVVYNVVGTSTQLVEDGDDAADEN